MGRDEAEEAKQNCAASPTSAVHMCLPNAFAPCSARHALQHVPPSPATPATIALPTLLPSPHLHACVPAVWVCVMPVAVHAHVVLDHELHHEALLQDGAVEHLRLDGQLDLEALGVRLSPDEASIHQLHLHKWEGEVNRC